MLDVDTRDGKDACQEFLSCLTQVADELGSELTSRNYRIHYSSSYQKMISKPYIADILDSAQEAFPFMWVNGEKYLFSDHVISKGIALFQKFKSIVLVA